MVLSGHCVAIRLGVGLAHSSAEGIGELLAYGFWDCRLLFVCQPISADCERKSHLLLIEVALIGSLL